MIKKKHIFLDLDETLICSVEDGESLRVFPFQKFKIEGFTVYKRPYLDTFLGFLFENFTVSFWSAGEHMYVLEIIKNILPTGAVPKIILWRDHCEISLEQYACQKSIEWIKNIIPLEKYGNILLIDDLEENCQDNGFYAYQIKPFDILNINGLDKDRELLKLAKMLSL
jgi:TFIIF-interacting CTD phosphatase-like protein